MKLSVLISRSRPDNGNRRGERGFTIIELIASLVIMAIVLVVLGSNVRLLAASWDQQSHHLQQTDMLLRGARALVRDLQSVQRITHRAPGQPGDQAKIAFVGDHGAISFAALEADQAIRPGLVLVNYRLDRRSSGAVLVRRTASIGHAANIATAEFRNPVIIFDDLDDLRLSYRAGENDKVGWRSSWDDPFALPAVVRIRAVKTSGLRFPDIVVRLRGDAEQQCIVATDASCSRRARPVNGAAASRRAAGQR